MFDKAYYDSIWGDVHRHDYCESLADQLIAKYNPKSVLDIGGGCNYLVKVLWGRGVEAYGLEISEYAVANSHGNVLLGSVTDIPFKDGQFDLVYSQGLWEYVKEEDISKAWSECLRVGRAQEHNFDYEGCDNPPEHQKLPLKPLEWWQARMQYPKILVGCPIHESKEYSLNEWYERVKAQTYPNLEICMAYSGDDRDFVKRWADKIPMIDAGTQTSIAQGQELCAETLRQKFIGGDYKWYFNLESDILIPSDAIEIMLKYGRDCDWTAHTVTDYNGGEQVIFGIACALFTKKPLKDFEWKGWNKPYDASVWDWMRPQGLKFKTTELWNLMDVRQVGHPHYE